MYRCPGCGDAKGSLHSTAQHAWKSGDERHEAYPTLDAAIIAVAEHGETVEPDRTESPETPNPVDDVEPSEATTQADGGTTGLGLAGPPEPSPATDDDEPIVDRNDDPTLNCPHCGSDTGEREQDLEPGVTYRCTECDGPVKLEAEA